MLKFARTSTSRMKWGEYREKIIIIGIGVNKLMYNLVALCQVRNMYEKYLAELLLFLVIR